MYQPPNNLPREVLVTLPWLKTVNTLDEVVVITIIISQTMIVIIKVITAIMVIMIIIIIIIINTSIKRETYSTRVNLPKRLQQHRNKRRNLYLSLL